jgi:hypothetical protein
LAGLGGASGAVERRLLSKADGNDGRFDKRGADAERGLAWRGTAWQGGGVAEVITIERQLAERIAAALSAAETRQGHLAQIVTG